MASPRTRVPRRAAALAFAAPMGLAAAAYDDKAKRDGSAGASKDGGSPFESW